MKGSMPVKLPGEVMDLIPQDIFHWGEYFHLDKATKEQWIEAFYKLAWLYINLKEEVT